METMWIIAGIGIVTLEGVLWLLFRRKVEGLCFAREIDQSFFRSFSLNRLRALAIVHTLALTGIVIGSTYLLW